LINVDSAGFDRFAEIANAHVGDDKVPGLVAAVSVGDSTTNAAEYGFTAPSNQCRSSLSPSTLKSHELSRKTATASLKT